MRGRKPTSTTQRKLDGNPGHRSLNDREPLPPPIDLTRFEDLPAELTDDTPATKEWQRLAPMLRRCRQITEADRAALIALCLSWSRYLEATTRVRKLGMITPSRNGYPMQNPYLAIAKGALVECTRLWAELGLTPSSRSRVKVDGDGPGPEGDPFSEFDAPPSVPEGSSLN
jgi:P27 family predicted phage terminase small subunit